MLKTLSLVVAGLLAGLAIAWVLPSDDAAPRDNLEGSDDFFSSTPQGATPDERFASMQSALRSETQARLLLEERVEALSAELAALKEERASPVPRASGQLLRGEQLANLLVRDGDEVFDFTVNDRITQVSAEELRARQAEREIARLVDAGITRDRAEHIRRRSDELQYEVMQAQFQARRAGQPVESVPTRDQMLRRELGDAEYEQLLRATGRLTDVNVTNVISGSPAERMGLKPGDRIVSYAGTRLFEIGELNNLTSQGYPNETVVVEIMRDGQFLQLTLPRGPLGVIVQGNPSGGRGGAGPPTGGPGGRGGSGR
jgi:hypothetical protein